MQIGRGISRPRGVVQAIHADPDGDGQPPRDVLALDQNTDELGPAAKKVIGPFERQPRVQGRRAIEDGVMERKGGDERQFRRVFRRARIVEQKRGVEIARRRAPFAAAPAAAGGLPLRGDPERAAVAAACQRQGFRVGRGQGLMRKQAMTGRRRRRMELHQNSEWAAALATPISGPG
jgi:hypothetical protein